uniref:Eukaryotic translation initiation factor 3 subunit I n=1 Tax=Poecilia reticulata TaxID=8081 RepID=A0A3P9PU38_POERE
MKPILLQGHERSITQIKYNREGDLLFSVAKDTVTNVWYSVNGERLGTYNGHTGAVWCVDCDWDTKNVLTGSADNSCRLWDCETGKQLALLNTNSAVRTCGFDFSGNIIMFSTDKQMGYQCFLNFFDLRDPQQMEDNNPYLSVPCSECKITSAVWGALGEFVIAGHENGEINQFSAKSGEILKKAKEHTRQINDIQTSVDLTMVITASKDNTSKLFDSNSLDHIKTFRTDRPVNSAAISPIMDHVVMGGGQEAMDVTTTSTRIGKFEARFFHAAYEEEFGRVKGHFGPINCVAFHPDGKRYCLTNSSTFSKNTEQPRNKLLDVPVVTVTAVEEKTDTYEFITLTHTTLTLSWRRNQATLSANITQSSQRKTSLASSALY